MSLWHVTSPVSLWHLPRDLSCVFSIEIIVFVVLRPRRLPPRRQWRRRRRGSRPGRRRPRRTRSHDSTRSRSKKGIGVARRGSALAATWCTCRKCYCRRLPGRVKHVEGIQARSNPRTPRCVCRTRDSEIEPRSAPRTARRIRSIRAISEIELRRQLSKRIICQRHKPPPPKRQPVAARMRRARRAKGCREAVVCASPREGPKGMTGSGVC